MSAAASEAHVFAWLVRRPVTLAVAFAALLVVGVIAYAKIPIQMMPDGLVEPGLQVVALNPGASALENEEKVARVLEEHIRTLAGIEEISSGSNDDSVWVWIRFDATTDMDLVKAEVRDRIERARPELPASVDEIAVYSWSNENMPILWFAVLHGGDSSRTDFLIDTVVQRRIEAVDGVGRLEIWGVLDDSMRILLDEDRVRAANLDLGELIGRLSRDNFALPLGEVDDGGRRVLLRSDMRFTSPEEIARYPIGGGLVLGDVARVEPVKSVRDRLFKIDGSYAYFGEIQKESQANVVATCHRLAAELEALERDPRLRGELRFLVLFDQGRFIETSLSQLRDSALWGGGLAVLILFLFLRRVRTTLAVALSIPFSVLIAIGWLYFTGGSFNVLTMTGITLAMGMLVDNSIVVIENVARLRTAGMASHAAAAHGTREVGLAVLLSTLTTVVVFLPLIFMTRNPMLRIMFGELGLPLCVSLIASLVVALVFLPVVAARVVRDRGPRTQRVAAALARFASAPARAVSILAGTLRFAAESVASALHGPLQLALRALAAVRVPLAVALALAAAWNAYRAFAPAALALRLPGAFGFGAPWTLEDGLAVALEIAAPVGLALLLLRVLPRLARRGRATPVPGPVSFAQPRPLLDHVVAVNHALMAWTLRHRVLAGALAALAYASVAWPKSHMQVTAFGEDENTGRLTVWVELEENFTLAEAEAEMAHYERFFEERRERFGFDNLADRFDERGGRVTLYWDVPPSSERHTQIEREVERDLRARPGHRVRLWSDGGDAERNRNMVTFRLVGPEAERLEQLGERAVEILERVPGLTGVSVPEGASQSQVRVVFDSDLAQGFGITPDTALQNIAWALRGWQLPRYQDEDREVPLIIEYDDERVAGLSTLRDLDVFNGQSAVPLSSFAQFQFAGGRRSIVRVNGQTSFTIEARVEDPLRQKELSEAGYRALRQLDLPRGFSIGEEDLVTTRQEEEFRELAAALLLSGVLVYVLMCILFESLLLPLAIMFTIPFAMVGSFWTLYVTGTAMDSVGWIGIIILVGVVVNNGIVLIDCIHGLCAGGMERAAAVLQGCAQRVRPVLMTALTTVIGLVPTAIAEPASEGIDYRALATCVAGGLAVSTLFTLWVVPLAYTLFDDVWRALVERFEMFAALQGGLSAARAKLAPHFVAERSPSS